MMPQQQGRAVEVPLLAGLMYCLCVGCVTGLSPPACKPQGLLQLDQPYPPPYRVRLPFCSKYACSCCNVSHALAVQRSVRQVLLDDELSQACRSGLVAMACSICDPEVGVGHVRAICPETCQQLFRDCSQDFFSYDESSGLISPCTSQRGVYVVCSQPTEVLDSGKAFCTALGYTLADADDPAACFDGQSMGRLDCAPAPQRAAPPPRSRPPARGFSYSKDIHGRLAALDFWPLTWLSRRHRRQLKQASQLLVGAAVTGGVATAVLIALRAVMQHTAAAEIKPSRPQNVREVLAKAASTRAAAGAAGHAAQCSSSRSRQDPCRTG